MLTCRNGIYCWTEAATALAYLAGVQDDPRILTQIDLSTTLLDALLPRPALQPDIGQRVRMRIPHSDGAMKVVS